MAGAFPHRRLVVGGGRRPGFPKLKRSDLSLNIDARTLPDVQADAAALPFASGLFSEVYYEKVPFAAFTGSQAVAIAEAARVLKPGGRLVANAVTIESEARLADLYARHGGELTRIAISRADPVGALNGWRPAMPVTHWRVRKP